MELDGLMWSSAVVDPSFWRRKSLGVAADGRRLKRARRREAPTWPLRRYALAVGDFWREAKGLPRHPLSEVARRWCLGKLSPERVL